MRSILFIVALLCVAPAYGQGIQAFSIGTRYGVPSKHPAPFEPCGVPVEITIGVGAGAVTGPIPRGTIEPVYQVRIFNFAGLYGNVSCINSAFYLVATGLNKLDILWPAEITGMLSSYQYTDILHISWANWDGSFENLGADAYIHVPDDPSLVGLVIYHQGFVLMTWRHGGFAVASTGGVAVNYEDVRQQ